MLKTKIIYKGYQKLLKFKSKINWYYLDLVLLLLLSIKIPSNS